MSVFAILLSFDFASGQRGREPQRPSEQIEGYARVSTEGQHQSGLGEDAVSGAVPDRVRRPG